MSTELQALIQAHLEEYCKWGYRVLPVSPKKIPLIKDWPNKASSDITTVSNWWKQFPSANIGIATGKNSGFWALDIDDKNDVNGLLSLDSEFEDFDSNQLQAHVQTPSGGLHVYFEWSDEIPVTVASDVLSGIDIRGERGFVMAPPSTVIVDGVAQRYEHLSNDLCIEPAPRWAIELAKRTLKPATGNRATKARSGFSVAEVMQGVTQGNRDNALYRYACHLKGCDVPIELAISFITEAASRCNPQFPEAEALEKLNRAYTTMPKRQKLFSHR